MAEEQVTRHINDRPDSVEIGTPSKGGAIKVYFDARNLDEAKRSVDAALQVRAYAAAALETTVTVTTRPASTTVPPSQQPMISALGPEARKETPS